MCARPAAGSFVIVVKQMLCLMIWDGYMEEKSSPITHSQRPGLVS